MRAILLRVSLTQWQEDDSLSLQTQKTADLVVSPHHAQNADHQIYRGQRIHSSHVLIKCKIARVSG